MVERLRPAAPRRAAVRYRFRPRDRVDSGFGRRFAGATAGASALPIGLSDRDFVRAARGADAAPEARRRACRSRSWSAVRSASGRRAGRRPSSTPPDSRGVAVATGRFAWRAVLSARAGGGRLERSHNSPTGPLARLSSASFPRGVRVPSSSGCHRRGCGRCLREGTMALFGYHRRNTAGSKTNDRLRQKSTRRLIAPSSE